MIRKIQRLQEEQQQIQRKKNQDSDSGLGNMIGSAVTGVFDSAVTAYDREHLQLNELREDIDRWQSEQIRRAWNERNTEYTINYQAWGQAKIPTDLQEFVVRLSLDEPKSLRAIIQKAKDSPLISHTDIRKLLHLGILRSQSRTYSDSDEKTFERRIAASNRSYDAHEKRKQQLQETRAAARTAGRKRSKRPEKKDELFVQKIEKWRIRSQQSRDDDDNKKLQKFMQGYYRRFAYRDKIKSEFANLLLREHCHSPSKLVADEPIQISKRDPIAVRRSQDQKQDQSLYPALPHPEKRVAWTSTLGHGRDIQSLQKAMERPTRWSASKLKNQFMHFVITGVPGLPPSDDQLVHTAHRMMSRCGIDLDAHAIQIYIHNDKADHKHAHVILNRVRTDGAYFDCHPTAVAMACHLEGSLMNKREKFDFQLDPIVPEGKDQAAIWKKFMSDSMSSYYRKKGTETEAIAMTGVECAARLEDVGDLELDVPVGLVKVQYLRGQTFSILHYSC